MYAIIGTGGKQYRVTQGDVLKIELLPSETKKVTFSEVYLVGNGRDTAVGDPTVTGARVTATVVGTGRSPKVLVFKMKRRKHYKRTIGHRQYFSSVRIDEIDAGGAVEPLGMVAASASKAAPKKKAAPRKKVTAKKKVSAKKKATAKEKVARKTATKKKTTRKATARKKAPARKAATTKKKTTKKKTSRRS